MNEGSKEAALRQGLVDCDLRRQLQEREGEKNFRLEELRVPKSQGGDNLDGFSKHT